jgi:hypothetical protein
MKAWPAYRHFWAPPALIGPSAKCLGWLFGLRLLLCAGSWLVTAHCTTAASLHHAVLAFLAQNIACNRLHSAEERTARWLAQTHDRVGSESIQITQEFLAQMLGVRRATVSVSVSSSAPIDPLQPGLRHDLGPRRLAPGHVRLLPHHPARVRQTALNGPSAVMQLEIYRPDTPAGGLMGGLGSHS